MKSFKFKALINADMLIKDEQVCNLDTEIVNAYCDSLYQKISVTIKRQKAPFLVAHVARRSNQLRLIGQKELVKTAITLENSMCIAVLSCLKQDTPWTKRVGKICGNS